MVGPILRAVALACALVPALARADGYMDSIYSHRSFLFEAAWEYGIPVGSLQTNLAGNGTPSGVLTSFRFGFAAQLSAGFDLAWNGFYPSGGGEPRVNAYSAMATFHWYLLPSAIQPYVGVGAGGTYQHATGTLGQVQDAFGFCGGPQIGVLLTFSTATALDVHARYEFTTVTLDVTSLPVKYPQWITIGLGIALY